MKKTLIICLMAFSGAALAAPGQQGAAAPAVLLAQAGHDQGMAGHGHKMPAGAPDMAHAKVSTTLAVSACWIRSMPAPAPSAGYFVVKNTGGTQVRLQSVASAGYGMVMLHQTTQQEGMSRMSATHDVAIPAGGQLEFKPGGYHAMLEKPAQAHPVGSKVAMDFLFDNGEKASAECEVKAANTQSPMSH
ncbi:copper chaperone PCu(A)C [Pollutimonas bauzanensis]|nr:copper chaperone PCu(A)C [Pollutimonas bauzanensis]